MMGNKTFDIAVIGAGPAGMAAALSAFDAGVKKIALIERDERLGGILNQCIHNGFGLHRFGEELTGPEYAGRDIETLKKSGIEIFTGTMVLSVSPDKTLSCISDKGFFNIRAKAIVLSMGCRERPRGALNTPGTRPAGVFTAGCAQKLMNIGGFSIGQEAVILGSGDIGLIMARRLTLEGAHVKGVFEIMPYSNGLKRNIVQCLDDYGIPLHTSCTVAKIHGTKRLEGVSVAEVDEKINIKEETMQYIPCDTLLLSVGLIPENELSIGAEINIDPATKGAFVNQYRQCSTEGVFACGNVLHVHDLVDNVSEESFLAGKYAAEYVKGKRFSQNDVSVGGENGISYTVPQFLDTSEVQSDIRFYMRVKSIIEGKKIVARLNGEELCSKKEKKFLPGEMVRITVKKELLANAHGKLVFRVE